MNHVTRGFTGRKPAPERPLPPGQYDTGTSWPVLTAEVTPQIDTANWTFTVDGLVERPTTWTWDDMQALPQSFYEGAIHCVTTWSKFDMHWRGVSVDTVLDVAAPSAMRDARARDFVDRLHDEPADRRRHRHNEHGSHSRPTGNRCRPTTADRRVSWYLTSTSGRAPSTCHASPSWTTTNRDSGRYAATTTAATHGSNSATRETEGAADRPDGRAAHRPLAACRREGHPRRDTARQDVLARARGAHHSRRRPAFHRPADRTRRLHRTTVVLGGVTTRGWSLDRPHRRAPCRR